MDISFESSQVRITIELTPQEAAQIVEDMQAPPEKLASEITNKLFNTLNHISRISTEAILNEMNLEIERTNSQYGWRIDPSERAGQRPDSRP